MSSHPNADVRMRGFSQRVSVANALQWLDAELDQREWLDREWITIGEAAGRVLADDVSSNVNVPNFQRAMMDGYALRAVDVAEVTERCPVDLKILGDCFPGRIFDRTVRQGEAVRIMTGAPMPVGADAVLPFEQTSGNGDNVRALRPISVGKNLGSVGEDVRAGEVVLAAGRALRPQDVGVLSSIGQAEVAVVRKPRVRIVLTGNELLPTGSAPEGCKIVDANGPMLAALVERDGGCVDSLDLVADDRTAILAALREEADLVIVSGGSSVGQEDHVPTLLAEHGELAIHGINMRPASPTGFGQLGGRLVFLLPGNPVACLCGYDFFAGRAVRGLGGRAAEWPYRPVRAPLSQELKSPLGRLDYVRVRIVEGRIETLRRSGASVLSSTTRAEGFVVIPAEIEAYSAGTEVDVFLYD